MTWQPVKGLVVLFLVALAIGVMPRPARAEVRAPVVFVPGILGSRLEDRRGVVWGDVLTSVRRFPDLEVSLHATENTLRATAILDTIGVLGPFKIGQYNGLMKTLQEIGFRVNDNLFIFPYDWRQSNFDSAAQLRDFIESRKQLDGRKINIVAHSMGGLVARIYLQELGGARRVSNIVTLGTPHLGSAESLRTFFDGMGRLKNFVAGGDAAVKRVVFSFPSMYELLPAYKGCCVLGGPTDRDRALIDILQPQYWQRFSWTPPDYKTSPRREFLERALARAAELQRIVARPLPDGVRLYKIAGDLISTTTRVYFDRQTGQPVQWDRFGGDGTVPVKSATADDETDAESAIQIHSTLFNDDHVKIRLRRILTTDDRLDKFAFRGTTGLVLAGPENALVPFNTLDMTIDDVYYTPGQHGQIRIRLANDESLAVRGVKIQAWLEPRADAQVALPVGEDSTGTHLIPFDVPPTPGIFRVLVHIPAVGLFEDYVVVISREGS